MKRLKNWMKNYLGKTMSFEPDQELEHFVCRFLETHGAVLEKNSKGFEALLPESLSGLLETPEYIRINKGSPDTHPESRHAYSINYGAHLLEKIVNAACTQVPLLACQLEFDYLKSAGFGRLINEQFSFFGSVGSMENTAKIKTEYLFLTCRYIAQSDEQKEGLVSLIFNLETGAFVPHMAHMLYSAVRDFKTEKKGGVWKDKQIKEIMEWVKKQMKESIAEEIGPFQESMTRRFRRDVANLEEYYAGLKEEMKKSLERPGLSDQLIKDRQEKIALLPDELARKKDDLFKKYSIKVKVELCSAMLISTPAIKILYKASIGRKRKNFSLIYNPVTKCIDPLVCQGCGRSATTIHFGDRLHLLCPACSGK
jgi:hypothetical protein